MADITARLIWYRLKENYENLAQSYEEFSWRRVDILDMLFLGWVLVAFVVVGLVNLYLRFFGLPKTFQRRRGLDWRNVDGPGSVANSGILRGGETAQWINAAVGWIYENLTKRPEFIETWLKALSEEAKKYTERDIQIRFDGIQAGGSPPQFSNVLTEVREKSTLTVLANLASADVTLLVSIVTKTTTHMQTTGCQVRVAKLCGPLRVQWKHHENPADLELSFQSVPEITLHVSPNSYSSNIDQSMVESVIKQTIGHAVLHLYFPSAGSLETISRSLTGCQSSLGAAATGSSSGSDTRGAESSANHDLSRSFAQLPKLTSGLVRPTPKADRRSFSENQVQQGFRLLVKLIKANGLMDKDFTSCDPYCTVSSDEPPQQHSTSVVKNTINPFFDEYFLLDITNSTKQIKFEVFDRSKQKEDDFLGQASVVVDDLRRLPSSRQIIPLTGRQRTTTNTSGSVTVEFLFMETNEMVASDRASSALETSPPRRRIEMNRALMPGGMTVTTKTTTTERFRDQRDDPIKYNDSPTRVEKAETVSTYASDSSPYASGTSSRAGVQSSTPSTSQDQILTNGVDSVTETALRQLSRQPQTSSQSATIVITGVQKKETIPIVKEQPIPIITTTRPPSGKMSPGGSEQPVGDPPEALPGDDGEGLETKKKSFASALKKRFSRSKKSRSQSADRAQTFRDESLLRPPDHGDATASDQSEFSEGGTLRKSRSHSFSSGFRNLFRRKKKTNMSRESSMSRISARGVETSREDSTGQPSPQLPQPKGSIARHNTPVPEFSPTTGHPYSTSVPARPSPLYDH